MNSDRDEIRGGWDTPGDDHSDAESAIETTGEFTIDYAPPAWYTQNASGGSGGDAGDEGSRASSVSDEVPDAEAEAAPVTPVPPVVPAVVPAVVPPAAPPMGTSPAVPNLPLGTGSRLSRRCPSLRPYLLRLLLLSLLLLPSLLSHAVAPVASVASDEAESGNGDLESGTTMRFSSVALKREFADGGCAVTEADVAEAEPTCGG